MHKWCAAPLRELADIRVSNVDKKSSPGERSVRLCNYMDVYANDYIREDLPFMEATASEPEIFRFKVERGDVLITKDSETPDDIGIPAVVTEDVEDLVCGYHIALLRPNTRLVDPVFLSKQLGRSETANYFARYAAGSTRYGLSCSAISNANVLFPSLLRQRKIAAILSCIDIAIEKTEALIDKYQQIKAGLMHDLFTRGVLPNRQLRPPHGEAPELYRQSPVGWVPEEWDVSGLAVKGRPGTQWIRTGPFGSSLKGEHWRQHGHPVITIGSLGVGDFIEAELLFIDENDAKRLEDFRLAAGDVVFSRVADVGRSVVIHDDHAGWIMSSNLMRIAVDATLVRPEYLQMLLAGDARVKAQIRTLVNSGGRDVANSDVLNRLRFAWPSPDEQDRIIAACDRVTARVNGESRKLVKLQEKKLGLMQDLLTGKVPVKVDEPVAETADA